jgi:hypothetical protein
LRNERSPKMRNLASRFIRRSHMSGLRQWPIIRSSVPSMYCFSSSK